MSVRDAYNARVTNYRVRVESESDPLATDPSLVLTQRRNRTILVTVILTLATAGLFLPIALYLFWQASSEAARKKAETYRVRVRGGVLEVGDGEEHQAIPLDQIVEVSSTSGYTNVGLRGRKAVTIFGLLSPREASVMILEARDEYLRTLRGETEESAVSVTARGKEQRE